MSNVPPLVHALLNEARKEYVALFPLAVEGDLIGNPKVIEEFFRRNETPSLMEKNARALIDTYNSFREISGN